MKTMLYSQNQWSTNREWCCIVWPIYTRCIFSSSVGYQTPSCTSSNLAKQQRRIVGWIDMRLDTAAVFWLFCNVLRNSQDRLCCESSPIEVNRFHSLESPLPCHQHNQTHNIVITIVSLMYVLRRLYINVYILFHHHHHHLFAHKTKIQTRQVSNWWAGPTTLIMSSYSGPSLRQTKDNLQLLQYVGNGLWPAVCFFQTIQCCWHL